MADNRGAITNQNRTSGISLLLREEQEVCDVMNEKEKEGEENSIPRQRKSFSSASSSLSAAWRLPFPAASKLMIPMAKSYVSEGKKLAVNQLSAPLKIPDWSQIYRKKLNMGFWEINDDDDDDDDKMIPPHELIDRRLSTTRIASYSMFEGIGRTLKGRDICKLRNAVLISTGFLEQ